MGVYSDLAGAGGAGALRGDDFFPFGVVPLSDRVFIEMYFYFPFFLFL